MNTCYLLLGSNDGNRLKQIEDACHLIEQKAGFISKKSSIYETASWGVEDLPDHYNEAIEVQTQLAPQELLLVIHEIENSLGRTRQQKWGLRSIDIDIIYYNNLIIHQKDLIIPHPLVQERNFALAPLSELAPNFIHPVYKKTNLELLHSSKDHLKVSIQ